MKVTIQNGTHQGRTGFAFDSPVQGHKRVRLLKDRNSLMREIEADIPEKYLKKITV